jgi:mannose-6-phosphate isomerase-like protein (cupin superfamily)
MKNDPTRLPPVLDTALLPRDAAGPWRSFDLGEVNGNAVRLRVMEDITANWHTHTGSDELFYVISGTFHMDTEHGTREIRPGGLFVVPAGMRHRGRVEGRTTMLVIDGIDVEPAHDTIVEATTNKLGSAQ